MDSLSNTLNARFSSMPDHLQWEMYHGFRNALSKTMQYMDKTGDCDPVLIGLLFNNQLRYRNSIMNRKVLVNKYVRETGKTEAYALLRRIDRVQNRIAHFYITTSNASLASQHEQEVITLNERLEALVPSLQQIGAEAHTWQMLRDKLQPGEVLIDFVLYSRLDDAYKLNPTKTYAALVLRKTDTIPGYEVLCRGRELADLNAAVNPKPGKVNVKDLIAERVRYRGRDIRPLTELYQLIWAKLEPHFKGQQKLYYIPNGEFALLPLEALGKVKGQYLRAEIKMEMLQSYLSFITPPANPALNQQIELWGDMPYGKGFDPLGAKELMNITEILTGSRFAIQQHDKSRATEQRFKQTPHTASIIHLSTHGFYAADVYLTNFTQLNYQAISPFAYLFYSGLAFANANIAAMPTQYDADWPGSNKDDGILYSYEIKDMDLHATDLVVLSACETGQGVSSFNEGVLGLQQAFKLAGVNRVLMSLWEVNRGFTENWMRRFYGWLKKLSGNVEAAFHATQSEMIKDGQSPYAWAGFVLVK
jgi:CHAT domain-containing protein